MATAIHQALQRPQLRQPAQVEEAMGQQAVALLATLDTECANVERLGQATAEAFRQHHHYAVITSFPGLGDQTGARVLAEIGDDRHRFIDARGLKAYAGSAPVTRASGRSSTVIHRRIKTTGSPPPATSGPSWRSPTTPQPNSITSVVVTTETATPPHYATSSTE